MDDAVIFKMEAGKELDQDVADRVMDGVAENYSQDISSAWKVAKKIEKMGWRIDILSSTQKEHVGGIKMVNGNPVSLSYLTGNVESDNLPEAICKAALLIINNSERLPRWNRTFRLK